MQKTSPPLHICIGVPRSGTSWLYINLCESEQIFLPCIKEARYWWGARSEAEKARALENQRQLQRDYPEQLAWLDRWERTDTVSGPAYAKLMGGTGLPSLDISPIYNTMPPERIADLRAALPESSRILVLLRNPLERNSSAVRFHGYLHGRHRGTMDDATMAAFMDRWFQQRHRDYARTVRFWRRAFGDRFGIFYYDDLKQDPLSLLGKISGFLGLDGPARPKMARKIYNTDRGTGQELYFPPLTPSQTRWISALSLADARAYAEVDPAMSERWCETILAGSGGDMAVDRMPAPDPVDGLLRMTENLGETCDLALFQRSRGYEPESFLRWSETPLATITGLLDHCAADGSWRATGAGDGQGALAFRPDLAEQSRFADPQTPLAGIEAMQILVERFTFQLYQKPCLYVATSPAGLPPEQQRILCDRLRRFNPAHRLLHVSHGDLCWQAGPEQARSGIYQARLPLQQEVFSPLAWQKLFENLAEQDDIRDMIDKMFS